MLTILILMGVLAVASPLVIIVVRVAAALLRVAWGLTKLLALLGAAAAVCVGAIAFAVWWCSSAPRQSADTKSAFDS